MPNGFSVNANDQNNSPNSSQISGDGSVGLPGNHEPSLISRTQKQHITQQVITFHDDDMFLYFKSYFHLIKIKLDLQVTTTTKTIREIQYIGPDGQPLDYVPSGAGQARLSSSSAAGVQPFPQLSYGGQDQQQQNQQPQHGYANYAEYPHRPPTPPSPSDRSNSPPPQHREPGKTHSFSLSSLEVVFHLWRRRILV